MSSPPDSAIALPGTLESLVQRHGHALSWKPYAQANARNAWRNAAPGLAIIVAVLIALIGFFALVVLTPWMSTLNVMAPITGIVLGGLIVSLIRKVGPFLSGSQLRRDLNDPRSPILLLRSFSHDAQRHASTGSVDEAPRANLFHSLTWSPEESLYRILRSRAPVLAVGRPGDFVPPTGATRIYVANESWQTVVAEAIGMAQVVVLRAGRGTGLVWEMTEVVRQGRLSQTLLVLVDSNGFPYGRVDYLAFREVFEEATQVLLPASAWNSWLIWFDDRGRAQPVGSDKPWRAGEFDRVLKSLELFEKVTY